MRAEQDLPVQFVQPYRHRRRAALPVRIRAIAWPVFPSAAATSADTGSRQGDLDIKPLPMPMIGLGGERDDRETLAVGDGQAMAAEDDPKRGVRSGVDRPQPDPLPGPSGLTRPNTPASAAAA